MFKKQKAYFYLSLVVGICILIGVFRPSVVFDYDFENFFPQDDVELSFYQEYRDQFGNDNDYLLIALGHEKGVFDTDFLNRADKLNNEIKALALVENTVSLLDLKEPIIGNFGVRRVPILQWDSDSDLHKSKSAILDSDQYIGNLLSEDQQYLLLLVQNQQQISKEDGDLLFQQISELLRNSQFNSYFSAGKIKAQGEFVILMQQEFTFFLAISLLLIVTLLFVIFRTLSGVIIPLLALVIGVVWTISFSLYTGKPLDVMSVMQPTILSVIGLAAIVHFFNHYLNYLRQGIEKDRAIEMAFSELFFAVFLTCLTTSLGFISLYFTSIPSLRYFGLYTGIGVLLMFAAVTLTVPGLLYLFGSFSKAKNSRSETFWRIGMRNTFIYTLKHPKFIISGFVFLSILAFLGLLNLKVNGYLLDNLPQGHELVEEFRFFDENFGGSKPLEIYVESGASAEGLLTLEVLEELNKLENFVRQTYNSAIILSPLTVVKGLNKAQNNGNQNAFSIPSKGQLIRLKNYLPIALEESNQKLLNAEDFKSGRLSTRTDDMGSYQAGLLRQHLEKFVDEEIDADLLQVRLTGTSNLIDISHESVTWQLGRGLGFAFIIVAIVAGYLFRSWRIALIVLLPNIIPLLWMCGVMWLLGIELKLTTAIIFTVAFGIAVDDSIHFMSKLKMELNKNKSWLYAIKRTYMETGKAIVLTTIILATGFSVLMFSEFGVTYYSGLLISISLVFALLADLFFLPLMLIKLTSIWNSKLKPQSSSTTPVS